MTTATATPSSDERLARTSLTRKLLIRPEFGALAGAIVVWLLFASQARDGVAVAGSAPRPTSRRRRCTGSARSESPC